MTLCVLEYKWSAWGRGLTITEGAPDFHRAGIQMLQNHNLPVYHPPNSICLEFWFVQCNKNIYKKSTSTREVLGF